MTEVDRRAQEAVDDPAGREGLIYDYTGFILSCAVKCIGRPVSQSDDEWSIALSAFSEAIDCYNAQKGSFLSHARLVINRRLIDYRRSQKRRREVSVPPDAFLGDERGNVIYEVAVVEAQEPDESLRDELLSANGVLKEYGFSFFDLAGRTPKKQKPKSECADAVNTIIDEPPLLTWMRAQRRLPLKRLCAICSARQKTISFFRYYVITGAEILTRDFPSLRRYFSFIRREATK